MAEYLVELWTEEFLVEVTPRQSIAVLSGKCTTKFQHQIRDLIGDPGHFAHFTGLFQVDEGTDVHAPNRTMSIVAGPYIITVENFPKSLDKLRQLCRVHGRIFHKGNWFFISLSTQEQAKARLTHPPNPLYLIAFECQGRAVTDPLPRAQRLQSLDLPPYLLFRLTVIFNNQDGFRVALNKAQALGLFNVSPGQIQNQLVSKLDGVGRSLENGLRDLQGLLEFRKVDYIESGPIRCRDQTHPGLHHTRQGPLRAHNQS